MKKQPAKKQTRPTLNESDLMKKDEFTWLAEINQALSPYWSARSTYQEAKKAER